MSTLKYQKSLNITIFGNQQYLILTSSPHLRYSLYRRGPASGGWKRLKQVKHSSTVDRLTAHHYQTKEFCIFKHPNCLVQPCPVTTCHSNFKHPSSLFSFVCVKYYEALKRCYYWQGLRDITNQTTSSATTRNTHATFEHNHIQTNI